MYSRYEHEVNLNETWHKVCIGAGFLEVPRLYSLQVGADARVDNNCKLASTIYI
jgi:hypothetical protein